jgi:hypothetical protein
MEAVNCGAAAEMKLTEADLKGAEGEGSAVAEQPFSGPLATRRAAL